MLPRHQFENSVFQHQGNYYTKHFTSWNQLLLLTSILRLLAKIVLEILKLASKFNKTMERKK